MIMKEIVVSKEDFLKTYKNKAYGYKVLNQNKFLPVESSPILASIVAHLMGDGNLSKDKFVGDFRFYGTLAILNKIRDDIQKEFGINSYKYYHHPKGEAYILKYNNCVFSRILELCGTPRGDKILNSFKVPDWIMNGDKEIKKAFLSSIFTDEMCRMCKRKNGSWGGLEFVMSKSKDKMSSLIHFLNQLKKLLNNFKITSSDVRVKKNKIYFRKDGKITYPAGFSIHTRMDNRKRFYFNVGFSDEEKQKILYTSLKQDNVMRECRSGQTELETQDLTGRFCCDNKCQT